MCVTSIDIIKPWHSSVKPSNEVDWFVILNSTNIFHHLTNFHKVWLSVWFITSFDIHRPIINEWLKLSGKCLTKEGNKCNFLCSDHNTTARLGKIYFSFSSMSSLFLYSSLHSSDSQKLEWEMISCFLSSSNNVFLSSAAFISMPRWRYEERNVECHFYFDCVNLQSRENPFPSSLSIDCRADERTCVHMHNLTASCKSLC